MCLQDHSGYLQTAALRVIKRVMQALKYIIVFRTFYLYTEICCNDDFGFLKSL